MYVLFFHVDWAGKGRLFTEQNKLGVCVVSSVSLLYMLECQEFTAPVPV